MSVNFDIPSPYIFLETIIGHQKYRHRDYPDKNSSESDCGRTALEDAKPE